MDLGRLALPLHPLLPPACTLPLRGPLLLSLVLHASALALLPPLVRPDDGRSPAMRIGHAQAYHAIASTELRLEVDFRPDHGARGASENRASETPSPDLSTTPDSLRAITAALTAPAAATVPSGGIRNGGSDCWVNGFRFCSP